MIDLHRLSQLALPNEANELLAWDTKQSYTRSDFVERVSAWHKDFSSSSKNSVAVYLDNTFEFACVLWAAWHSGKTPILLGDCLPSTIAAFNQDSTLLIGDFAGGRLIPANVDSISTEKLQVLDLNQCQLKIFTSGSTGVPIRVEKQLRQLTNELAALEQCFSEKLKQSRVLGTVSHQHIYGLLFRLIWPLCSKRIFHAQRLEYPEEIIRQCDEQACVLVASPAHLKRLPEHLDWSGKKHHITAVFSSGGPLTAQASDHATRLLKQRPIEVFGSSETGGIAWRQQANSDTSVWQTLPGVEIRAVDECLSVRSTYLPDDDWYQTQDRVSVMSDGTFEFLGRKDRIVKLEERRISLSAIEERLNQSSLIAESRVLVLGGTSERMAAAIMLTDKGRELLDENGKHSMVNALKQHLAGHIDRIAVPRYWRFVDSLPVDTQGKTTQRMLTALFRPLQPDYRLLDRDNYSASIEFQTAKDLMVFDGHFSEQAAIVPGVALIDWAQRHAKELFGIKTHIQRMEALKFQQVVLPETCLMLKLQWDTEKQSLHFHYESSIGVHSHGRLVFEKTVESERV